MTRPALILHAPGNMARADGAKLSGFMKKLRAGFTERGVRVEIRKRDNAALETMGGTPDFHLVHNGRIRHPRVLNTGLGYVFPFWYLDPQGVFGDSSLVGAAFDPANVDPAAAQRFFEGLNRRHVLARASRHPQAEQVESLPDGGIAIFLQGWSDPVERVRHMAEDAMVDAVLADTGGRPVLVKPHPNARDPESFALLARLSDRSDVQITQANIHDILAASALSVSISSAVSLEGMMHRKPAVLFGRSDFHHNAETVTSPGGWPAARDAALARDWPHQAFLYWFLELSMINAGAADLTDRVAARIAAHAGDILGSGRR